MVVRADRGLAIPGAFHNLGANFSGGPSAVPAGVVSCAQLATVPALGRCPGYHLAKQLDQGEDRDDKEDRQVLAAA